MSTLQESIENGKKEWELVEFAQKLFPGRVSFGPRTEHCQCCGKTHTELVITIKEHK